MNDSTELIRKKKEELEGVQDIQSKLKEKSAFLIQEIEEIEESGWCFGVRIYQNDEEYDDFQCKSSKAARCLHELIRDISDGRSLKVTQYRAERSLIKKPIDFCEAPEPTPEKEIETIEQEAHEILIGKGFEWNEVHKEWRKKELQIWHGDDGYYFAKFHNHNIPVRLPSMPFASWVESVEKMTAERENAEEDDQDDPFAELIQNLERLKNGIIENDRQDRIELLKLAVQIATEHRKTNAVVDFGAATETFYKQLCKLAGMDEPQAQTVESDAPESPQSPQANAQDPRKVLAENGWAPKDHPYVDLYEKDGIELWWSGDIWAIKIGDKNVRWDGTAANLAELTAKPAANTPTPEEVLPMEISPLWVHCSTSQFTGLMFGTRYRIEQRNGMWYPMTAKPDGRWREMPIKKVYCYGELREAQLACQRHQQFTPGN